MAREKLLKPHRHQPAARARRAPGFEEILAHNLHTREQHRDIQDHALTVVSRLPEELGSALRMSIQD